MEDIEMVYLLFGRGESLTQLGDGSPFYDQMEAGVVVKGLRDIGLFVCVEDGKPVVNRLTLERLPGERDLSAGDLQRLPLDRIVTAVQRQIAYRAALAAGHSDPAAAAETAGTQRGRWRRVDRDLLEKVAHHVLSSPEAPTKAVQENLFCSHRTASRWIAEARRQGVIDAQLQARARGAQVIAEYRRERDR